MKLHLRVSHRLVLTILIALLILPVPVQAGWRQAKNLPALIEELDTWLDANAPWPRRAQAPVIRWANPGSFAAMTGLSTRDNGPTPRGAYDEETQTIYLANPWRGREPNDVSVLLHELVHHRQATAGHWYCAGAQELPAYRLQEAWLSAQGLSANINWIAVVLEAGCTPRDIHPD